MSGHPSTFFRAIISLLESQTTILRVADPSRNGEIVYFTTLTPKHGIPGRYEHISRKKKKKKKKAESKNGTNIIPAEQRRRRDDSIVARGILDNLYNLLKSAALEIHRGRSKHPGKIALCSFRKLRKKKVHERRRAAWGWGGEGCLIARTVFVLRDCHGLRLHTQTYTRQLPW